MRNYRLRFSSMIPKSWYYKFKNSSTTNNKMSKRQANTISSLTKPVDDQRKSYYFTRDLTEPNLNSHTQNSPSPNRRSLDPPRKSSKKRTVPISPKKPIHHRKLVSNESISTESISSDTEIPSPELSVTCSCKTNSSYEEVYGKVNLPPIITKQAAKQENFLSRKNAHSPVKKYKANNYSPRISNRVRVQGINGGRKSGGHRRISLSESMAVVKTSTDPGKDFKESMVEMILENNMKSSKDLEDLLACYLSLNSNEYHDLIIKVFKQIWLECTNIRL